MSKGKSRNDYKCSSKIIRWYPQILSLSISFNGFDALIVYKKNLTPQFSQLIEFLCKYLCNSHQILAYTYWTFTPRCSWTDSPIHSPNWSNCTTYYLFSWGLQDLGYLGIGISKKLNNNNNNSMEDIWSYAA